MSGSNKTKEGEHRTMVEVRCKANQLAAYLPGNSLPVGELTFYDLGNYILLHKVEAKEQQQGVGTSLVAKLVEIYGHREIQLTIPFANEPLDANGLRRFYEKFGFVVSATMLGTNGPRYCMARPPTRQPRPKGARA